MKRMKLSRRRFSCLILLAAVILLTANVLGRIKSLRELPLSQQAARRYAGESGGKYVQLSAFFHPKEELSEFRILLFNETLQAGLNASGLRGTELPYACSASGYLYVQSNRGTFPVPAIGTGGDFFLFHPYSLLYGSLLESPAGNGIVLNDRAAWLLFGGVNAVGLPVLIGGEAYVVTGVVSLERDRADLAALQGTDCLVFVPLSVLGAGVTAYEVLLPEPVKGYGESLFAGLGTGSAVNNSDRFTPSAIRRAVRDLPAYHMDTVSAELPYWENAARNLEMRVILWTLVLYAVLLPLTAALLLALLIPLPGRSSRSLIRRRRKEGQKT